MGDAFGMAQTVAPLALARALPLALLAPLAGRFVPLTVSLSLVLALSAPVALGAEQPIALAGGAWLAAVGRELCLGLTFALASAVPLLALASTGRLIDQWRRPGPHAHGPHAALYELVALFSFFTLGGHRAWFSSYARTFVDLPFGELGLARARFLEGALTIGSDAIALSVSLALPLLVSLWFCELAIGLVLRAGSGTALSTAELLRTSLLALLVLATAPLLIERLPQATRAALTSAAALLASIFG